MRDGDEATGDSTSAQIPAFIPWELLVDGEPTPIEYHWDGWVALATVAVLAGAGDSLKSWLCLYLAVMTAAERAPFAEPGVDAPPLRRAGSDGRAEPSCRARPPRRNRRPLEAQHPESR